MSEQEWAERGCPHDVLCPLTGKLSRPVFVELEEGPDETEDDELPAEAA